MRGQAPLFARGRTVRGRARRASDETMRALRVGGRLEKVDAALVAAHRIAADNLDAAERLDLSPYVVTTALRGFLEATHALYARVGMVAPDDDDAIWRELSAPLGHPPTA